MPKIYAPIVQNSRHSRPFLSTYLERVNYTNASYVHPKARVHSGIKWLDDVDWGELETRKKLLSHVDRSIQIKNSPERARIYPQYQCSPIKGDYWLSFAQFILNVIDVYEPYAVELWNEPEVRRQNISSPVDEYIGCFGETDMYSAGVGYGKFITAIYDYVKPRANVEIWAGALMLADESHWEFAKGFVSVGKMDYLSYHSYSGYDRNYAHAIAKAMRLREFCSTPLILSETAYQWDGMDDLQIEYQAEYLEWTYQRLKEYGVRGMNWYTLANNGWKNTDMVYKDQIRPVYNTYRDICDKL